MMRQMETMKQILKIKVNRLAIEWFYVCAFDTEAFIARSTRAIYTTVACVSLIVLPIHYIQYHIHVYYVYRVSAGRYFTFFG